MYLSSVENGEEERGCCYIVSSSRRRRRLHWSFFYRKKEEEQQKNGLVVSRKGNVVWLDKPDVACCANESEKEKCKAKEKKNKRERRHHHQATPEERPTVKRQIIVRFIAMHFFSRSLHPCNVLSLLLCFSLARALLAPHFAFACSPLSGRALSLSLSTRTHTNAHDQCART